MSKRILDQYERSTGAGEVEVVLVSVKGRGIGGGPRANGLGAGRMAKAAFAPAVEKSKKLLQQLEC